MSIQELTQHIFFDIETVRATNTWDDLPDQWKHLWAQKAATFPEFKQGAATAEQLYLEKAGIFAEFAKVICVSLGRIKENGSADEGASLSISIASYSDHSEQVLLQKVGEALASFERKGISMLAGHNIKEFDIPFLARRMLIQGVLLPPQIKKLHNRPKFENKNIDTLELWRFGDYKNYTRLDLMAACLGVSSSKTDINGSQVGEVYWGQNDLGRIAKYCSADVETTIQVALRLFGHPIVPEQFIEKK